MLMHNSDEQTETTIELVYIAMVWSGKVQDLTSNGPDPSIDLTSGKLLTQSRGAT